MKRSVNSNYLNRDGTGLAGSHYVVICLLSIFWLAISLPVIAFSQWFPLDMPVLFHRAKFLTEWLPSFLSPNNGSGRYFPLYWLFHSAEYLMFGATVWPYFIVLSAVYLVGTLVLCRLLWRMTGSFQVSMIFFLAAYLGSPVAENIATIGKGEPLTYCLIALMLFLAHRVIVEGCTNIRSGLQIALCFLLSLWIKETSLVVAGFAATGLFLSWLVPRLRKDLQDQITVRPYVFLFGALLGGWLTSRLPYVVTPTTIGAGSYTSYEITRKLIKENIIFYIEQVPDVFLIGILCTALLGYAAREMWKAKSISPPNESRLLIFAISLCAMGWAYCLAMFIWRWPMVYYMLLPAIAFKFSALYGIYLFPRLQLAHKMLNACTRVIFMLTMVFGAFVLYYVGLSQIEYSRIYTAALQQYKKVSGGIGDLTIESYPFFAEQIDGTQTMLKDQLGMTTWVNGIGEVLNPEVLKEDLLNLLQVRPEDLEDNFRNLPKRGSYVLVFTGNKLATWFLRGVTPFYALDSQLREDGIYHMQLVGEKSTSFGAVFWHEWTESLDFGSSYLGYKLYKVLDDKPKFLWRGRYPDGWVGLKSSLLVDETYVKPIRLTLSMPNFTLPNSVKIFKNGELFKVVNFTDQAEVVLEIERNAGEQLNLNFEVAKAVSPKMLGINKDDRKLAARIALAPN